MLDELKPCPFCGSPAKLLGGPDAQELFAVWCQATSGKQHCLAHLGLRKADAIAEWNRRA